jgi:hypothetical protein
MRDEIVESLVSSDKETIVSYIDKYATILDEYSQKSAETEENFKVYIREILNESIKEIYYEASRGNNDRLNKYILILQELKKKLGSDFDYQYELEVRNTLYPDKFCEHPPGIPTHRLIKNPPKCRRKSFEQILNKYPTLEITLADANLSIQSTKLEKSKHCENKENSLFELLKNNSVIRNMKEVNNYRLSCWDIPLANVCGCERISAQWIHTSNRFKIGEIRLECGGAYKYLSHAELEMIRISILKAIRW